MEFQRAATPTSVDRRSVHSNRTTSLNERLNTDYVDFGAADEGTLGGKITRAITGFVGDFVTPRQLLIVLRILKAVTFCFLILTLAADMMYVIFLEVLATGEVRDIVGGRRDMIIRVYGLFLAGVAIAIEIDVAWAVKSFYGFKGFIARAFLLFFVAAITGAHPLHEDQLYKDRSGAQNNYSNNNNAAAYDDANAAAAGDDANAAYDDAAGAVVYDDFYYDVFEKSTLTEIPDSVIVFQMVTSFILGVCAITYFVFGLLCLDRFTSKAYLSSNDPLVTTAIPQPVSTLPRGRNSNSVPESVGTNAGAFRPPS